MFVRGLYSCIGLASRLTEMEVLTFAVVYIIERKICVSDEFRSGIPNDFFRKVLEKKKFAKYQFLKLF